MGRSVQEPKKQVDRFESMSAFVCVVEAGGFTAASRNLDMPLTSVSRKVSDLEEMLGVPLLIRSGRKVALTDNGRQFYEASRRILNSLEDAKRRAAAEYRVPRGELMVTAPFAFGRLHIVPIVSAFLRAYKDVRIDLRLIDRPVNLIEQGADLSIRVGELPDSSLIAARAGSIPWAICGSPDYLAKRGIPMVPRDLTAHDCVTFTGPLAVDWEFAGEEPPVE